MQVLKMTSDMDKLSNEAAETRAKIMRLWDMTEFVGKLGTQYEEGVKRADEALKVATFSSSTIFSSLRTIHSSKNFKCPILKILNVQS